MLNFKRHLETVNNLPEQSMQDSDLYLHACYKYQRASHLKPKVSSFYLTSIAIFFFSLKVPVLELRSLALLSTFILN